ncbi:PP2C family protein-serine/threonine phosphatase [Marinospirillum alkaliphilum]|uniref:Stage II sporulation protein E (SpoIIE) n=1 Tax=Marinospirillum alkaliphilum DSM 21637 TaxID=1122209 RepID=A0A1K1W4D7_9GAMM|nr:PP2C family protein-serine/threonine phosphatase [Marinospirillum alkaliphilum]SFX32280.1 Stage II sporulation protein E (SpoIIE) [Marinospirillum alkaliphilum DSM 21637]
MTGIKARLQQLFTAAFSGDRLRLRQQLEENTSAAKLLYAHLLTCEKDWQQGFRQFIHSSGEFCGDLILARPTPCGRIMVLHADATGHGLSATLTLLPLAGVFKQSVDQSQTLQELVTTLNQQLCQLLPDDRFVAATLVEVDPAARQLQVWNGSMPPLLLLDQQGNACRRFHSRNLALGILEQPDMQWHTCELPDQGYLFGFSDGLCDQVDESGQCWGQLAMLQYLEQPEDDRLFPSILGALHEFRGLAPLLDDISMFLLDLQQVQAASPRCTGEKLRLDQTFR